MYNKEQILKDYIKFYATPDVQDRGEDLFVRGAVSLIDYIVKSDKWAFTINGSKEYRVNISGVTNNNIETSCNCPFTYGKLCKHCIAALHFISENINESDIASLKTQVSVAHNRRSIGAQYELTEYNPITIEWILKNIDSRNQSQFLYRGHTTELNNFSLLKNKLVFNISHNFTDFVITIEKVNNELFISSTETANVNKLKLSEAHCLKLIAQSPSPELLSALLVEDLSKKKKKTLTDFGLSPKADFESYFEYNFDPNDGFLIKNLQNSEGLIPISGNFYSPLLASIQISDDELLQLPHLKDTAEKRELGFVFLFKRAFYDEYSREYFYDEEFNNCEIIPIIGKPNKTGDMLSNFIEEYDAHNSKNYIIPINDKINEVLKTLELFGRNEDEALNFQYKKKVFSLLIGYKYLYTLKKGKHEIRKTSIENISLSPEELDTYYEISNKTDFIQSELKLKINNKAISPSKINNLLSDNQIFTIDNICYHVKSFVGGQSIKNNPGPLKMVNSHKQTFFERVVQPLSRNFDVDFKKGTYDIETIELDFHKKQIYLTEQSGHLIITPHVVYDNNTSVALYHSGDLLVKNSDTLLNYKRNRELEDDFIDQIAELHPNFAMQKSNRLFYIHMNEFVENLWFYKFFDQLTANNVEVFGLKNLKNFKYSPYQGKITTSVSSGQDWFEVNLDVSFGNNSVSLKDIKKAVLNKEHYIRLKDGSVGIMPTDWFHKLEKYFRNGEIKSNKLEISKLRFSIVDELFDNIEDAEILEELSEKKRRLASFTEITKTIVPKEIKADLRHYQKEGLNWLNFLDEMQWGGILADDMGLGKTLQILSFIQHLEKKEQSTSLIVVPTTLLFNWQNEIKKFAPKLKAFYHYGSDRQKSTKGFENYQLVFTTYGILIRDIEILRKFKFNYAILDESQAIKNPASRRYKAANLIYSNNRIALSGTPIENSTFDLFAQMNFVNRGMLGGVSIFKDNYSNPIDKEGNELMANELQRIVSPFILRRTKEKVANELPSKTEDIIYCEMDTEQRTVYDAYRNNYKNQLLTKISDDGIGKSKMMVLEALTRLRQICDSPALLAEEKLYTTQAIKIKEILRHITNKTANHKILIFSQFVKMLGLVKNELEKMNIKFEYLDGKCSTMQREKSVKNFQENDELRVFLISIKAGGTGLNLTAADYVYIMDPWWNPAVENQAIDRCYRIGQDKKVFAYRMICKDTVEEKIMELQSKKKKIAGDIIQTDENLMKTINTEDIKELFS